MPKERVSGCQELSYVCVHVLTRKARIWPISCENFIKMCSHTPSWFKSELFLHAQKPREQLLSYYGKYKIA
ncbi:MAG: hypothetical protein K0R24_949 [Gammaproteobacteria bacterium]|jgi:hypothetical protein|nr:hypothetical protein [Gammaproteobacteria bacterium]